MPHLPQFPLPLQPNQVPSGYGWEERDRSLISTTTAFHTRVAARDQFLDRPACVICGKRSVDNCHIIPRSDHSTWTSLMERGWIPSNAKKEGKHDPRNGLTMCGSHRRGFDEHHFFIRYFPDIRKFVLINYSDHEDYQEDHCKAIALDISDHHTPFPSLFIIHEMRVRGYHPFQALEPPIPTTFPWNDRLLRVGAVSDLGSFNRHVPPTASTSQHTSQHPLQSQHTVTGFM